MTFVGEGRLSWRDTLGGGVPLVPTLTALLMVLGLAAFGDLSSWGLIAGIAFALWLAVRSRVPQTIWGVLRRGRPHFRVAIDEDGVRAFDANGRETVALDWFEIARASSSRLGLVLMMRVPRNGANAVLVPRTFFSTSDFDAIVALARGKLPASPPPNAPEDAGARPRVDGWRTVTLWIVLAALLAAVYFQLRQAP